MSTDYSLSLNNAGEDAHSLPTTITDPVTYSAHENARATAKYVGKPIIEEIMALIAGRVADADYRKTWTCVEGLNVGDPVYISATDTVTLADATNGVKSQAIGFVRYKPTTETCYISHFRLATGLSGLTAGNDVYLTDAGGFSATPGTVSKWIGRATDTDEAILVAIPQDAQAQTNPTENLFLNPDFSAVLPGTHTAAIKNLTDASSDQNCQILGMKLVTGGGTVDVDVDQDTTGALGGRTCAKVTIGAEGDDYVGIMQEWSAAEKLFGAGSAKDLVSMCRGKYLTVFADFKNSHASVNSFLRVTTDGTGGTDHDSSGVTGDTDIHRVGNTSFLVPTDAEEILFQFLADAKNAADDYFFVGNVQFRLSDAPLTSLPYVPRLPINLTAIFSNTEVLRAEGGANSGSGDIDVDAVSWTTAWDLQGTRTAWSSAFAIYPYMYSTAAAMAAITVKGKGVSGRRMSLKSYVIASQSTTASNTVVDIGQDGLCTASWSGANSILSLNQQAWIGEGL